MPREAAIVAVVLTLVGCGGSDTAGIPPADFSGAWSGVISGAESVTQPFSATIHQSAGLVDATVSLGGRPGSMRGWVDGERLEAAVDVPECGQFSLWAVHLDSSTVRFSFDMQSPACGLQSRGLGVISTGP